MRILNVCGVFAGVGAEQVVPVSLPINRRTNRWTAQIAAQFPVVMDTGGVKSELQLAASVSPLS